MCHIDNEAVVNEEHHVFMEGSFYEDDLKPSRPRSLFLDGQIPAELRGAALCKCGEDLRMGLIISLQFFTLLL